MDEKSTQAKDDGKRDENNIKKGASTKTLHFLKMFARTYQTQSSPMVTESVTCMN